VGGQGAPSSGSDLGEGEAPSRIRLLVTARRVRIDPARKRARYILRLEGVMRELDRMISDPEGFDEIQVKAMNAMIRAVRMCYRMVRDVDVERLEDELEELKRENKEAKERRGGQELGYEIEEDPAE